MTMPGRPAEYAIDPDAVAAAGRALQGDAETLVAAGVGAGSACAVIAAACGGPLAAALTELRLQLEGRARHLGSALDAAGTNLVGEAGDAADLDAAGARRFTPSGPEDRS